MDERVRRLAEQLLDTGFDKLSELDFGHSGRVAGGQDELLQLRAGDFGDLPAAP